LRSLEEDTLLQETGKNEITGQRGNVPGEGEGNSSYRFLLNTAARRGKWRGEGERVGLREEGKIVPGAFPEIPKKGRRKGIARNKKLGNIKKEGVVSSSKSAHQEGEKRRPNQQAVEQPSRRGRHRAVWKEKKKKIFEKKGEALRSLCGGGIKHGRKRTQA